MEQVGIVLLVVFAITLLIGTPIAFSLATAGLAGLLLLDVPLRVAVVEYFSKIGSSSFLAIPFFILAGELMNAAQITPPLVELAYAVLGRVRGGLGQAVIAATAVLSSITGSATSACSAMGSAMVPEMRRRGYDEEFTCGVIAASSVLGPIIPPSILMVIYSGVADVSLGALFLAGFVPGIIMALGLMTVASFTAKRRGCPVRTEPVSWREVGVKAGRAVPALFMPVIILGGVFSGVFSVTEAAAVAAGYGLVYGLVTMPKRFVRELFGVFSRAAGVSVMILTIVGASAIVSWALSASKAAEAFMAWFTGLSASPAVFLMMVNVVFLILGCLIEPAAAIVTTVPLLLPLAKALGVPMVHLGLVIVVNLCIGFITPPVGLCLYTLSGITKNRVEFISRSVLPFFVVEVACLLLITYLPGMVLWLPGKFGLG